jgi:hypothetical protein
MDRSNLEFLKYASKKIKHTSFNICLMTHQIPEERKGALVYAIFKTGDRTNCNSYRGISLLNRAYKIYAKITVRLNAITDQLLDEESIA